VNTETGRIYDPELYKRLRESLDVSEADIAAYLRENALERMDVADLEAGKIVPVSDQVAQKVKLGERELARRQRRRKARRS
jgi:flagellar motor switch protein FliM